MRKTIVSMSVGLAFGVTWPAINAPEWAYRRVL